MKPPHFNVSPYSTTSSFSSEGCCVSLRNVGLNIGERTILKDITHVFPGGKWTCLLGKSGIGKSMLLRAVLGLLSSPGRENVQCTGDLHMDHPGGVHRAAAYMAQQDLLLPWLSVRENITLGAKIRGLNLSVSDHDRANRLLEMVGLSDRMNDLPNSLSGGMRQRAALARTLWENRPVIVMDEPFSALDALTRMHIQDLASDLLDGKTVIMVTHDPIEAVRVADEIVLLEGTPVTLSQPIPVTTSRPRSLDDANVFKLQKQVINRLMSENANVQTRD